MWSMHWSNSRSVGEEEHFCWRVRDGKKLDVKDASAYLAERAVCATTGRFSLDKSKNIRYVQRKNKSLIIRFISCFHTYRYVSDLKPYGGFSFFKIVPLATFEHRSNIVYFVSSRSRVSSRSEMCMIPPWCILHSNSHNSLFILIVCLPSSFDRADNMNCKEHYLPELELATGQVREALQAILYTILLWVTVDMTG